MSSGVGLNCYGNCGPLTSALRKQREQLCSSRGAVSWIRGQSWGHSSRRGFQLHCGSPSQGKNAGRGQLAVRCAAGGGGGGGSSRSPEQISSDARIRSEVIAPFRTLRMALSLAFIASAGIGGLIAFTRVIGALGGAPNASPLPETLQGLAIDVAAVVAFALLYRSDKKSEQKSIARITREETLSNLRIELANGRLVTVGQMRGTCRLLIISGTKEHIEEALRRAEPLKKDLVERGVMLVPFCTDGSQLAPTLAAGEATAQEGKESEGGGQAAPNFNKRFIATPIYTNEWARWLDEQMSLANVSDDKPVYISLRIDGRVRGSGVGFPSFQALALQLPPQKGMWNGPLDGLDGRV